jgi:nicotinate-nucleotide adenylyltransferase
MLLRGVFGGTFDPIHLGHLRCAWEVSVALEAPIHMIPCRMPVHRGDPSADADHRMHMLNLALAGKQRLLADDRELRRETPSWMVDTLSSLRDDHPDDGLCLIVGEDAFAGLHRWHRWQALFELAHIVIISRPGHQTSRASELSEFIRARLRSDTTELLEAGAGLVLRLTVTALEISASAIRGHYAAGGDARYLLPESVREYIVAHGLYRSIEGGQGD